MALSSALIASGKIETWSDTQGGSFKGEPSEVFGPLAVFRGSSGGGRRLPWRVLSPADCVRFHAAIAKKPARADDWTKATGVLTAELINRTRQRKDGELVETTLAGRPEPLLLIALFVDNSEGKSWDMLGKSAGPFQELVQKYPGQVEGIQVGMNHSKDDHRNMALQMNVPWLLAEYYEQSKITVLRDFSPARGDFKLVVFSRDGVPLFSADNPKEAEILKVFADTAALLELQRPGNPRTWADRVHYLTAIQPSLHAGDATGPVLVGDPIMPQGLKERKIFHVEAKIDVAPDGKVAQATVKEDASIPPPIAAALADALKKAAVFVPAVDHGKFVAGSYEYVLEIPR